MTLDEALAKGEKCTISCYVDGHLVSQSRYDQWKREEILRGQHADLLKDGKAPVYGLDEQIDPRRLGKPQPS
jgi:hypothetical protein